MVIANEMIKGVLYFHEAGSSWAVVYSKDKLLMYISHELELMLEIPRSVLRKTSPSWEKTNKNGFAHVFKFIFEELEGKTVTVS